MSSPFELRFSCLNLAKDIQEQHNAWSFNQAQLSNIPYTQPSADIQTALILSTAHQLSLFINGDFDKLGLPDDYIGTAITKPQVSITVDGVNSYFSKEQVEKAILNHKPDDKFASTYLCIESSNPEVEQYYTPTDLIRYAYEQSSKGRKVIYVVEALPLIEAKKQALLGLMPPTGIPVTHNVQFRVPSDLKFADADVIIFDSCYIYGDLTLILPTHKFKQVIVYRGELSNPNLSTDDYFSHFMVNTTQTLIGARRYGL